MVKWPWKKDWEKGDYIFILQEYGAKGGRGWADISEPTGEIPKKEACMDLFNPGSHYRVLARGIEDGQFKGIVWKHYEPSPFGIVPKEPSAQEVKERVPKEAVSPSEVMKEYAEQLKDTLMPLSMLGEVMKSVRESFFPVEGGGGGGSSGGQMPPLEFDGKAPWMLHPYIVQVAAESIKDVIDHAFERVERITGTPEETPKEEREEEVEEEFSLPRPSAYLKEPPKEPEKTEEKPKRRGRKE